MPLKSKRIRNALVLGIAFCIGLGLWSAQNGLGESWTFKWIGFSRATFGRTEMTFKFPALERRTDYVLGPLMLRHVVALADDPAGPNN